MLVTWLVQGEAWKRGKIKEAREQADKLAELQQSFKRQNIREEFMRSQGTFHKTCFEKAESTKVKPNPTYVGLG